MGAASHQEAKKDNFWDCNRYPCLFLSIAMQIALKTPAIQLFLCKLYLQLHHRKTWGLAGSSSEHKIGHNEEGTGIEVEDEWWKSSLWPEKGGKASRR